MWNLFDHYSLRARLQPALLTLLPAALAVFAWTGPGEKWTSALWTLFGTAGGTYFLAMLARNKGKRIEPGLWASWGGSPTTQLLRHSGIANPMLRERWHKYIAKLLGKPAPTVDEEATDPTKADQFYAAGVKLLIDRTRNTTTYPLVYKENVQYGFCRNLYAMRITGIVVASLGIVVSCSAGIWLVKSGTPKAAPWVCAVGGIALLAWWITSVTASWVKVPAFAYAERLLESTEKLSRSKSASVKKGEV